LSIDFAKYQYRCRSKKASLQILDECTNVKTAELVSSAMKSSKQILPVKAFKKLLSLAARERKVDKCKEIL